MDWFDGFPPPWLAHLLPGPAAASLAPITFPLTPLNARIEIAPGADLTADPSTWPWADITTLVFAGGRASVTITRGRADESAVADTSSMTLTVDNRDGRFSSRNPLGTWYGLIRKGTPIRVFAEGYPRFTGFIAELPPRWDVSGNDRYSPIVAKGIFYRLTQGASPVRSPIKRTVLAAEPDEYWPLEDGVRSTRALSAIEGDTALTVTSGVTFGTEGGPAGAAYTTAMGPDDRISGVSNMSASPTGWTVAYWVQVIVEDPIASPSVAEIITAWWVSTSAAIAQWRVVSTTSTGFSATAVNMVDSNGTLLGTILDAGSSVNLMDGDWHLVVVTAEQSGADIAIALYIDDASDTDTIAATTLPPITSIQLGNIWVGDAERNVTDIYNSHFAIWHSALSAATVAQLRSAGLAYDGELAHVRAARLCDEEGVGCTAGASVSQAMGPQAVDALLPLLRDCEASDQAYMYEGLDFGIVFQGHAERHNLPVTLALDYDVEGHVAPPLEPTDDDQQVRNDVEVTRDGGSTARVVEARTSQELSIPNVGRRDESLTLSLYDDNQPQNIAGWRIHKGTYPGYRYPAISLDLAAGPALIPTFAAADLGFRATISNPPTDIGPEPVDVIVEGYTETLNLYDWDVAANCSLNGPNFVYVVQSGDGNLSRLASTSTLDAEYNSANSSLSVTSTSAAARWIDSATYPAQFPFLISIAGERMMCTAIVGTGATQVFSVTRGYDGMSKTLPAGSAVQVDHPAAIPL